MMIGSQEAGERAGIKPMARVLAGAAADVEPRVMGFGPAVAIPKALARAGLTLANMDDIEINEAFAVQVLGCLKTMDVAFEDSRVNPSICSAVAGATYRAGSRRSGWFDVE